MKPEPKSILLNNLLAKNTDHLESMANEKKIDITSTIRDELYVYADAEMLDTVIRNLLTNALKFTNAGGKITISARKEQKRVYLSIADTGIGMNKENLQQLFRIEVDTKTIGNSPNKGSGLGLILCKELINKNNGNIKVESEVGKGSIFTLELPESFN